MSPKIVQNTVIQTVMQIKHTGQTYCLFYELSLLIHNKYI